MSESVELVARVSSAQDSVVGSYHRSFKRVFDILVAGTALVCVAPLLLFLMLLIVIESPGSPLFSQYRVGQNGRIFRIFKLRTMHLGADKMNFRTIAGDGRLTRIGLLLRRLNVDELPQLLNILNGDMSIIGPRPLSLTETNFLVEQAGFSPDYPGLVPRFRPGLVGLEQVNRNRDLTYAERFEYNYLYEMSWTPFADLRILMRAIYLCSPVCVAVGGGAAIIFASMFLVH